MFISQAATQRQGDMRSHTASLHHLTVTSFNLELLYLCIVHCVTYALCNCRLTLGLTNEA